jgi:D-lyxose ketol-isomerase
MTLIEQPLILGFHTVQADISNRCGKASRSQREEADNRKRTPAHFHRVKEEDFTDRLFVTLIHRYRFTKQQPALGQNSIGANNTEAQKQSQTKTA